jgi:hypothetical protein
MSLQCLPAAQFIKQENGSKYFMPLSLCHFDKVVMSLLETELLCGGFHYVYFFVDLFLDWYRPAIDYR